VKTSAIVLTAIFCLAAVSVQGQVRYTVSGYVKDAATGEELIGAAVFIEELSATGSGTNAYGFYSITIPEGEYTLTARYLGYESRSVTIDLRQNIRQDFSLHPGTGELEEVEVTAERSDANVARTQMGIERVNVREIRNIPVIFGEQDILKTIQLLPGVSPAEEGGSGFFVRGGTADQNLILLDEATVYNPSHLMGFFSVFNSDAIRDVTLYKGNQPAEYGGRLSSVLDIKMKEGNNQRFGAEGGIGLISSRLLVEGPLVKDRGSFTISGRRTYADLFLKMSGDSTLNQANLYFYDLNAKANYRIDEKNRVFLSGYFGQDRLGFSDLFGINWGNATGTLRWNHLFSDRLFSNTSVIFSNYDYDISTNLAGTEGRIISRIRDYSLKQDFQYFHGPGNVIKFGVNSIYHEIIPGAATTATETSISELNLTNKYAWNNAVYISHEYNPARSSLGMEYGLRLSTFSPAGPGTFYTYDDLGEIADSTIYSAGQFVTTYFQLEPRLAVNYLLNEKSSIKTAYTRNTQNLHLLSSSTSGNPTDLWIPGSNNVKPQIADQVSLGYFRNFKNNQYEFSTEVYYRYLQNQIDYKDGAELQFNENVESQLLFGTGRAYGIEFTLKKTSGKLTGWLGYTLSRTEKKIDGINNGEYYPAGQDRTHDISVVAMYEPSPRWTLSASWVYYTGNAATFPSGKYEINGQVVNYYTERNGHRMPDYQRLDIGVTWHNRIAGRFQSSWSFSLYNTYGQENAYAINFREDPNDPARTQAVQTTLFRWIPSVTYNFKF
jgi:hypothetical protein